MPRPSQFRRLALSFGAVIAAVALAGCASVSSAVEEPAMRASEHPDPGPVTFAVVGDSITAWSTLEPGQSSWVGTARAARVMLEGGWAVSGATTGDMLAAIDSVPDADVLVIMAGTNDFLPVFPDWTLEASLDRIVGIAEATGIDRVVLSAIAPNDHRRELTDRFNEALEELAFDNGWTWVDPWVSVRRADGGYVEGVSADGIHPSQQVEMRVGAILRGAIVSSTRDR